MDGNDCLKADISVPFPSDREAEIAYNSLRVDKEPRRSCVGRDMKVDGRTLHVHWEAKEARMLRVSVNSFMDHLNLVVQTMDQFGPPAVPTTDRFGPPVAKRKAADIQ